MNLILDSASDEDWNSCRDGAPSFRKPHALGQGQGQVSASTAAGLSGVGDAPEH
ncbi:MAG: hypothetical protein M0Z96_10055 [Actinomycetota bacterium]|nr:hypothetical protein [Actinomycetota bacterium]